MGLGRRAEMGVGTLIIFIAMILVAAIAAAVVLQTAGSLQQQALSTGQQSRQQIATSAVFVEVSAIDGASASVDNFSIIMKLAAGSNPMKLSDVLMSLDTFNTTTTFIYDNSTDPDDADVDVANENGTFTGEYLQQGPNFRAGNMQRGDVLRLHMISPRAIGEDEHVRINFIPKIGTQTGTSFITPDVISERRMYLYP